MRIDGCENDLPFCYRPQGYGLGAVLHGELYYSYHAEFRKRDLLKAAEAEPALALAAECCNVMGLFPDCPEMQLLSVVTEGLTEADRAWLREIMPRLRDAVRGGEACLKRLYFSWILPVVAAFDAGEGKLAASILLESVRTLEKSLIPHS